VNITGFGSLNFRIEAKCSSQFAIRETLNNTKLVHEIHEGHEKMKACEACIVLGSGFFVCFVDQISVSLSFSSGPKALARNTAVLFSALKIIPSVFGMPLRNDFANPWKSTEFAARYFWTD
jgi:hypothetical protein